MSYDNEKKESNLTTVDSISDSDKVRVVVNGRSRSIPFLNFKARISNSLSAITTTSNYTAASTVDVVFCDVSGGSIAVTLPDATTAGTGKKYYIKKIDGSTNNVTVTPSGADTIDGGSSLVLSGSGGARPYAILISNGFDWYIFSA